MTEFIIETRDLTKTFKDFKAVDSLNLKVEKGEIFGFLGPNGAGKSTSIKMILGLMHPDSGDVILNGTNISENPRGSKKGIGYLPERCQFYRNLTALQTLEFFADLKGVDKSECLPLLKRVGLEEKQDKKVGTFSKGMTQLVGVAQSLLGDPQLLIYDEPTSGLDPRWAKEVKDIMKEMNQKGTTVFFSTHLLSEVQELCDRASILNQGKLVVEDTIENLGKVTDTRPKLIIKVSDTADQSLEDILTANELVETFEMHGDTVTVSCDTSKNMEVLSAIQAKGIKIEGFRTEEPSLEDAFLRYTTRGDGQ